jgi:integrase
MSKTSINRQTPLHGSKTFLHGYPRKLVLYKTAASRFYQVRLFHNGKYTIRSTKTDNTRQAKKFAEKFFIEVLAKPVCASTCTSSKAFSSVAARFFEAAQSTANPATHRNDLSRHRSVLLPAFKDQDISTITNAQIAAMLDQLRLRSLSPATLKHHCVVLSKIMKFAVANDLMRTLPLFPRVTARLKTTQKRDALTLQEYRSLCKSAERLAHAEEVVRGVSITLEMKYLMQFMVNSFIRPSDLRVLKHKHIRLERDGTDEWLVLSHPATKTTDHEVQAMPDTVHIYKNLLDHRKQHREPRRPDDYVFLPAYKNRNTAMSVIGRLFRRIVEKSLIEEKTGKNITLYSLRHTSIMFRLTIGQVDSLSLARNARTSQAMIDKFYASHLTTDQVRKQLHAFPNR